MSRAVRTNCTLRRELILEAALKLSAEIGYKSITRDAVANVAGTSSALIGKYFPTMHQLKIAVMQMACQRECLEVVAQGLSHKNPHTLHFLHINEELRQKVMAYLSKLK